MSEPGEFRCLECATCCRNLIETQGGIQRGLPLTKLETALFPKECVAPKVAVGVDRPENVILYQVNVNCCPHVNGSNQCQVYPSRPLMCQSFPIVAGAISNRCRVFNYRKPGRSYDEPYTMEAQLRASDILEDYIATQIKKHTRKGFHVWEYDLKEKKWVDKGPLH